MNPNKIAGILALVTNSRAAPFLLFLVSSSLLISCATVKSVKPGSGSIIVVHEKDYHTVWTGSVEGLSQIAEIVDSSKADGVLKSHEMSPFSWGLMGVFIQPIETGSDCYVIEIACEECQSGWEADFIKNMRARFKESVSKRVQRNRWELTTKDQGTITNIFIDDLYGDTLLFVTAKYKLQQMPISSIDQIKHTRPSKVLLGIGFGALAGFPTGVLIAYLSRPSNPTLSDLIVELGRAFFVITVVTALGGLFGGLIGVGLSSDVVYDFTQMSPEQQREVIETILIENLE